MSFAIMLPAAGALLVAMGAVLLKRGWWPRRIGRTPHCRKCDYILVGDPTLCPECGSWLYAWSVVRGERHRQTGLAASGGSLALLGLALLLLYTTSVAHSVDWVRYKPLAWLLHDLRSGNTSVDAPAWDEIHRRLDAHLLSDVDEARITDAALQSPAAALPYELDQAVAAYLADRFVNRKLTAAQADRFIAGRMSLKLLVRPVVGSAGPLPYWLAATGRGLPGWWHWMRIVEYQLDRGPVEPLGAASDGGLGGGWTSGSTLPPVRTPGTHHLRVRVHLAADLDRGTGATWNEPAAVLWQSTQDLTADFQVVNGLTPIKTVAQPAASVLQPLLKVHFASRRNNSSDLDMIVETSALPVDCAFDVFLRIDGMEYPAGEVVSRVGFRTFSHLAVHGLPRDRPPQTDVLFRSSKAVARGTIDVTQIWKGEIILPNVPLPTKPPSTRPASAPPSGPGISP